ncbi:MAG: hypothetical protein II910_04045 [Prevotella sp.]|nr:hypothetical protein [Prevotella sp.]MBQ6658826.1 hypothetical protein [Prevotella sp.]
MNKIFHQIILIVQTLLIYSCTGACNRDNVISNDTIVAQLTFVRDTYPFSNAVYEIEKDAYPEKKPYHTREIELYFRIKNETITRYFLPYKSFGNDSCYSTVKLWFQSDSLRVVPHYTLKRFPYDSLYLNPKDSITFIARINRFPDWQIEGCDAKTHYKKLIKLLNLEYEPDTRDLLRYKSKCRVPILKFVIDPQNYEIFDGGKPSGYCM